MSGPPADSSGPLPDPEEIPPVEPVPAEDLLSALPAPVEPVRSFARPTLPPRVVFWLWVVAGGIIFLVLCFIPGEIQRFAFSGFGPLP